MHIHSKSNIIPISDWTWIGAELKLDWTWIVVSGLLHLKRNETMMWFSDEVFHHHKIKKIFLHFSCHYLTPWLSMGVAGDRKIMKKHEKKLTQQELITTCWFPLRKDLSYLFNLNSTNSKLLISATSFLGYGTKISDDDRKI